MVYNNPQNGDNNDENVNHNPQKKGKENIEKERKEKRSSPPTPPWGEVGDGLKRLHSFVTENGWESVIDQTGGVSVTFFGKGGASMLCSDVVWVVRKEHCKEQA